MSDLTVRRDGDIFLLRSTSEPGRLAQASLTLRPAGIAQPPKGDLCHEAPTHTDARMSRPSATGSIDNSQGGFLLH
jgi:hypothetical protein